MIRYLLLFLLAAAALSGQSGPARADSLFASGNSAYQKKDYSQAIRYYQQVLDSTELESAALYYNLGTSYYQTGQLGESILHYHRALRLDPGNEEILHNLKLAEEKRVDSFEELPRNVLSTIKRYVFLILSPASWAWIAVGTALMLLLGLLLYYFSPYARLGFTSALLGLLLSLAAGSLAYSSRAYRSNHQEAVVLVPNSYVKSGPSSDAPDAFMLHEGTTLTIEESLGDWRKVRLPDGKIGWITQDDIQAI